MRSHPKFSSPCAPPPPRRRVNSERLQQSRTRAALRCFTRTACTLWPRKVLIWRHFRSDSRRSSIGNGSAWAAHSSQFGRTGDSQSERIGLCHFIGSIRATQEISARRRRFCGLTMRRRIRFNAPSRPANTPYSATRSLWNRSGMKSRITTTLLGVVAPRSDRSEEHTSELQSPVHLVCRLLLEKKKKPRIVDIFAHKKKKQENITT